VTNHPRDRFDDIPAALDRRGAHRAPQTRLSRFAPWLIGLAGVAVLVVAGVVVMTVIDNNVSFTGDTQAQPSVSASQPAESAQEPASDQPSPTAAQPKVDPAVPVVVLNGTSTAGLAGEARDKLTPLGVTVERVGDADSETHAETIVYYPDAEHESAALGIVQTLGLGRAELSTSATGTGTLTVVLGRDFANAV